MPRRAGDGLDRPLLSDASQTSWRPYDNQLVCGSRPSSTCRRCFACRSLFGLPLSKKPDCTRRICCRQFPSLNVGEILMTVVSLPSVGWLMYALWQGMDTEHYHNVPYSPFTFHVSPKQTGYMALVPLCLVFMTACRKMSLMTTVLGMSWDRSLLWHKGFAYLLISCAAFHGATGMRFVQWEWEAYLHPTLELRSRPNLFTGALMLLLFLLLLLTALPWMRRRHFEVFIRCHWVLFICVMALATLHKAWWHFAGTGLFLVDVAWRLMSCSRNPDSAIITKLPAQVIRLEFMLANKHEAHRRLKFQAGQYVFLCVPAISGLEWHPFSLSSAPHQDRCMVHVRVLGDWTKKLYDYASRLERGQSLQFPGSTSSKSQKQHKAEVCTVLVDGPYGAPALDIQGTRYACFLFVSGGIGVTTLQSYCQELLRQRQRGRRILKIWNVWSVRDDTLIDAVNEHERRASSPALQPQRLPFAFCPVDLVEEDFYEVDLDDRVTDSATSGMYSDVSISSTTSQPRSISFTPGLDDAALDRRKDVFVNDLYLTHPRPQEDYEEGNIRPELQNVHLGRPELPTIFAQMAEFAHTAGESRVAVMVCGPKSMVIDVQALCAQHHHNIAFDLHREVFHL